MYSVYVIKSVNKNYVYIGLTSNLNRRVSQHNNKRERTTRSYSPFRLIYTESAKTRVEARQREKYLKSGCGREWIKNNFNI